MQPRIGSDCCWNGRSAKRRNDAAFAEVTDRMFRRLYHEAFHAYLADHVAVDRSVTIDRWLNEGLALIFEAGQLDGDTLRIDAPNAALLAQLQRDLASTNSLSLAELLVSNDRDFLATHTRFTTSRHQVLASLLPSNRSGHLALV